MPAGADWPAGVLEATVAAMQHACRQAAWPGWVRPRGRGATKSARKCSMPSSRRMQRAEAAFVADAPRSLAGRSVRAGAPAPGEARRHPRPRRRPVHDLRSAALLFASPRRGAPAAWPRWCGCSREQGRVPARAGRRRSIACRHGSACCTRAPASIAIAARSKSSRGGHRWPACSPGQPGFRRRARAISSVEIDARRTRERWTRHSAAMRCHRGCGRRTGCCASSWAWCVSVSG